MTACYLSTADLEIVRPNMKIFCGACPTSQLSVATSHLRADILEANYDIFQIQIPELVVEFVGPKTKIVCKILLFSH